VRLFLLLIFTLVSVPALGSAPGSADSFEQCLTAKKAGRPPEDRSRLPTDSSLLEWRNKQSENESVECRSTIAAAEIVSQAGGCGQHDECGSAYEAPAQAEGTMAEYWGTSTTASNSGSNQTQEGSQARSGQSPSSGGGSKGGKSLSR
jgi:hypothetical protein